MSAQVLREANVLGMRYEPTFAPWKKTMGLNGLEQLQDGSTDIYGG